MDTMTDIYKKARRHIWRATGALSTGDKAGYFRHMEEGRRLREVLTRAKKLERYGIINRDSLLSY